MVAFLGWARSIVLGTLNAIAKFVLFLILLIAVLALIGLFKGDGLPDKMLLTLDLRSPLRDSAEASPFDLATRPLTVMDIVLALDRAGRDPRVKGLFLRVGGADLSIPRAEQIVEAIKRFRAAGKSVIAQAQAFESAGLGDYLVATSAEQIWMQPQSEFSPAGTGASAIFLRGLFDKINAVPQITKRTEFKSAADTFMEKGYTAPDRLQTTAFLQSWYDSATAAAARARRMDVKSLIAGLQVSPQFAEAALRERLIDKLGYDDEAEDAASRRAGGGGKYVSLGSYWRAAGISNEFGLGGRIALIEASGEIVNGTLGNNGLFGSDDVIAGDDLSGAIRSAAADKTVKAILLRIDSPGGAVEASAQILDAVKKARAAGKPVVVSMGVLAASGGYYVSCAANKIVAEPGTLTGSIGVLTGKVSVNKSLATIGVNTDQIGIGKNALFDSSLAPYTADQWASLNREADLTYAQFMREVAWGRKMPLSSVQQIAKGRVWTGADAKPLGLVDKLGGFWTAVAEAKSLAGISAGERVVFKRFPQNRGFFDALSEALGSATMGLRFVEGLDRVEDTPVAQAVVRAIDMPRNGLQMRVEGLPDE